MAKQGPIILAEDDLDDQEILREAFDDLGIKNELKFFDDGQSVLDYLTTTKDQPFLIISDVNLPQMSGPELFRHIHENEFLQKKSIPFIFLTTSANPVAVKEAYDMMVQGYFQKENSFEEVKRVIKMIVDYWLFCKHPNNM